MNDKNITNPNGCWDSQKSAIIVEGSAKEVQIATPHYRSFQSLAQYALARGVPADRLIAFEADLRRFSDTDAASFEALLKRLRRGDIAEVYLTALDRTTRHRAEFVRLFEACEAVGATLVIEGRPFHREEIVRALWAGMIHLDWDYDARQRHRAESLMTAVRKAAKAVPVKQLNRNRKKRLTG